MDNKKLVWHQTPNLDQLNKMMLNTGADHCGVEFIEVGDNYIVAKMPVDKRTKQPFGLLHGGMSVMLAETVASVAATYMLDRKRFTVVGQEINANHVRAARSGWVFATARPHYVGGRSQVWEIRITDEQENLICIARMTAAAIVNQDTKV
jgi:1,4-dihydroxy-2-naphthoyl-CoA hydrolase